MTNRANQNWPDEMVHEITASDKPAVVIDHIGHVFTCEHNGTNVTLTNEHGCETTLDWEYAKKLLGVK